MKATQQLLLAGFEQVKTDNVHVSNDLRFLRSGLAMQVTRPSACTSSEPASFSTTVSDTRESAMMFIGVLSNLLSRADWSGRWRLCHWPLLFAGA